MDHSEDLPLREGILRWCDPTLVAAAQQAEARSRPIGPPPPRPNWMAGARMDEIEGWNTARSDEDRNRAAANQAWAQVLMDLRRRLEQGELVLTGVKVRPTRGTAREILPGTWAADFRFKTEEGAIEFDDHRYVAVRVGLPGHTEVPDPAQAARQHIDVEQLDDETILRLLYENAERAMRGGDGDLFPPGKLSLIPFVKRKMQTRGQ